MGYRDLSILGPFMMNVFIHYVSLYHSEIISAVCHLALFSFYKLYLQTRVDGTVTGLRNRFRS